MGATVTKLPLNKVVSKKAIQPSKSLLRKFKTQRYFATACGSCALVLTALSLAHLSNGIHLITGCPLWESLAMALGIDVAMIVTELSLIFAINETIRKDIGKFAHPFVIGTIISSAALNGVAFAEHQTGIYMFVAAAFGIAIPGMIYTLSKITAKLYLTSIK